MTLRIMLLGLVASMGFELPSGSDLARWTQSGRDWVDARLADRSERCVEVTKPDVSSSDCLQASESCRVPMVVACPKSSDDKAFEAVSEAMVTDFAADLVAKADEPASSELEPSLVALPESPAVGLPAGEELASTVVAVETTEVIKVLAEPSQPVEVEEVAEVTHERLDRITTAVRLTREALQAWAEVIQDPVDETTPAR